jgi:23S rRNA pseudouridine2605 synthase
MRLNQYLAHCGVASRRKAEELILAGKVSLNHQPADHPGIQVVPGQDQVRVNGALIHPPQAITILFHKPKGVICSRSDPQGRQTLYDFLPPHFRKQSLQSVGRLDYDSSGLIILTNEGQFHFDLEHPSGQIERIYQVKAKGTLTAQMVRQLLQGVALEDGPAQAQRVVIQKQSLGFSRFLITIGEGRNREVRRLCAVIGLQVLDLKRIAYGPYTLSTLPVGAWREMTQEERALFAGSMA